MIKRGKKIFRLLASILEFPTSRIGGQVNDAMQALEFVSGEARLQLAGFRQFCLDTPLNGLEQLYAKTFDRHAGCCPYVGHHLFCRERTRRMFVAKLREHYVSRVEPSDHVSVLLGSLVVQESIEEARDLIAYCLIPALNKMMMLLDPANPYRRVLHAVLLTLETEDRNPWAVKAERYGDYEFAGATSTSKKQYE